MQVAASIAHAASTALPPFAKTSAPAVAASGLPVIATQWRPWRTGFTVRRGCACAVATASAPRSDVASRTRAPERMIDLRRLRRAASKPRFNRLDEATTGGPWPGL